MVFRSRKKRLGPSSKTSMATLPGLSPMPQLIRAQTPFLFRLYSLGPRWRPGTGGDMHHIESSDVVTEVSGEGVPGGRPIAHSIRDKTTNYASIDDLHYELSMRSVSRHPATTSTASRTPRGKTPHATARLHVWRFGTLQPQRCKPSGGRFNPQVPYHAPIRRQTDVFAAGATLSQHAGVTAASAGVVYGCHFGNTSSPDLKRGHNSPQGRRGRTPTFPPVFLLTFASLRRCSVLSVAAVFRPPPHLPRSLPGEKKSQGKKSRNGS